ncbi:class A beta-lactamase-related serine hydrolase [Microcella daejeonensis]|uniref:Class A beta-lactamase-related serine hydrolase n=1 Tax=Microcella daejeonensis TaxID=2994971 RepID=A0A9E8MM04_9MICO|nr:serine hydrolase [Microcella daejeonensis]WAB82104.1 class A beta-lactamase-related serine hydrolase [Microcella daejeonensis]
MSRRAAAAARDLLDGAGLTASFLARDLDSGLEIAHEPDRPLPAASLAKVPLAAAVLDAIERGVITAGHPVVVPPGLIDSAGPTGLTRFRHPATIAAEDLVSLAVTISDSAAADALQELIGAEAAPALLARWGVEGWELRSSQAELARTPLERVEPADATLVQVAAIAAASRGGGHPIAQLDGGRASTVTARGGVDLLAALWRSPWASTATAARLRAMLGASVIRQRMAPDLESEDARWSSKTGTVLTLRHEMGVVEHRSGARVALAMLTRSSVPMTVQPAADATMGAAARLLIDAVRDLDLGG